MNIVNIYEAKSTLSSLIDRANKGEEIILAKAGKPKAKLVGLVQKQTKRKGGQLKGKIWISEDFDRYIPEEFLPYIS